jgi:hypothetical protein
MITLADLKTYLGITVSTDDTLLGQLILSATAMIESIIGKSIVVKSFTEYVEYGESDFDLQKKALFDLNKLPVQVILPNFPVVAISSIKYGDAETSLVSGTDYSIDLQTGIVTLSRKFEDLVIVYTAGFATSPYDLQQVCKEMVKEMFAGAKGTKGSGTIKSKNLGGFSVTYELGSPSMEKYMSVLNKYATVEI